MSDRSSIDLLYSPIALPEGFDQRLTGRVFAWQWARGFSPLLDLYAFIFLFGGAVCSAIQYSEIEKGRIRFLGNILIAIGTLLPGIGGTFTRFGYVEVLYHGVHWTHVHLLWLLHDEEGSLRIFACKSADLGRVAFAQLIACSCAEHRRDDADG